MAVALPLLAYGSWSLRKDMQIAYAAFEKEKAAHSLSEDIKDASNFLTDQVRSFIVTNNADYLASFWNEVETVRRRERALSLLSTVDPSAMEAFLLGRSKAESDRLVITETRAMRLVCEALGYPEGKMPAHVAAARLSEWEGALSPKDKLARARELVFGAAYVQQKSLIMGDIEEFAFASRMRTKEATLASQKKADRVYALLIALYGSCFAGGVFLLLVYYLTSALPIAVYIRQLAAPVDDSALPILTPRGTRELVALAEAFNRRREERMEYDHALLDSQQRIRTHLRLMPLAVVEIDARDMILSWNPAAERTFGFSEPEAVGQSVMDLIVPADLREEMARLIDRLADGSKTHTNINRNLRKDGSEILCEWFNTPLYDSSGAWIGWASIIKDITKQREETDKILWLSRHDPLTGLFNRRHLVERLEEEKLRSSRTGGAWATIMLDVDFFKGFNDRYGHKCGDLVLTRIARVMTETVRATDAVGRWGGEEFLILLPETSIAGALELAEKIRHRIEESRIDYDGIEVKVTVTAGVAECRGGAEKIDDCIRRADEALLAAKAAGRNRVMTAV